MNILSELKVRIATVASGFSGKKHIQVWPALCNYDQPKGWWCSRFLDHEGPCALRMKSRKTDAEIISGLQRENEELRKQVIYASSPDTSYHFSDADHAIDFADLVTPEYVQYLFDSGIRLYFDDDNKGVFWDGNTMPEGSLGRANYPVSAMMVQNLYDDLQTATKGNAVLSKTECKLLSRLLKRHITDKATQDVIDKINKAANTCS